MPKAATPPDSQPAYRERIVDAAIACFLRFGLAKTTVEDIAREAGLARATVYRNIPNQDELYEAVSSRRLSELAERVKPVVARCKDFEEALVKGALEAIKGYREDKISMMMIESTGDLGVERFLIAPKSPVNKYILEVWGDALKQARNAGRLRADLSDVEIAAWARSVIFILVLSSKLSNREIEAYLRKFLVPSITMSLPRTKAKRTTR